MIFEIGNLQDFFKIDVPELMFYLKTPCPKFTFKHSTIGGFLYGHIKQVAKP
jgi:hypothetical protein